jgi:Protein of unknown function (DUF4233)
MRVMCSSVLGLQAVVLGLTAPVMITLTDVSTGVALAIGLGLAAAALVITAMLGHRWAIWAGHLLQVATIGLGFVVPVMFLLGSVFAALWVTAVVLGARIDQEKAARSSAG